MNLNQRNLARYGFRSSHPLANATSLDIHWKREGNTVIFADGMSSPKIGLFKLSPKELREFKAGKLSLVPPGCCSPSARKIKEDCIILLDRKPKNHKELQQILQIPNTVLESIEL